MGKKLFIVNFILLSWFVFSMSVFADECSFKERAELNKMAGSVTASYEIIPKEDGTNSFKISVYNITSDLFVNITIDNDDSFSETVVPKMTDNGTYSFVVDDETNIIKYNFAVSSLKANCLGDLKKFSLTKPKKNKYHDYNECKFADTEDYSYCQEWIVKDFTLSEKDILNKIEEQREYLKKTISTSCANCSSNVRSSAVNTLVEMYRKFIVIGLSIGISLDMIYIYLKVSNIRRSEL